MRNLRPPRDHSLLRLDMFLLRRRIVRARKVIKSELRLAMAARTQAYEYGLRILNRDSRHAEEDGA